MDKYIMIEWPEIQYFMEDPRYKTDCYLGVEFGTTRSNSIYFVKEDFYNDIEKKLHK